MNILKKKQIIRLFYKKKINHFGINKKENKKIISIIMKYKKFILSKNIAIYHPNKYEINLIKLVKINKKKNFFLPKIICYKKKKIIFTKYIYKCFLFKNKFNILETNYKKNKSIIDIIFTPLISFDIFGTRLGKGKGFYDKYFKKIIKKNKNILLIGIGLDYQLYKYKLPKNKWDISLHKIITPSNIWNII